MKNFILLAAVLACTFISCGEEDPDISGFYTLVSLKKDCDDPEQNISVVAGDNEVLGTTLNFSGTMLFTVGGAFETDYTLEADFSKEDVFIEGSYALTNELFNVCGNNGCMDNPVPSGNQVTIILREADCVLTITV